MDKEEKTSTGRTSGCVPKLLVSNVANEPEMSSSMSPVVVVSNYKKTKQVFVSTIGLSDTDINMKSLLQNLTDTNSMGIAELNQNKLCDKKHSSYDNQPSMLTSQRETVRRSDINLHVSEKDVHVEMSEPHNANKKFDKNQDTIKSGVEEKSPVILFKWGGSSKKPLHCQICDMAFSDGELLREHLTKHDTTRTQQQKPYPCRLCYKSFQSERSLERHQFVHSGQSLKRCKFCYKVFANKENLDKHILMHNGQKMHRCQFCDERFTYRQGLETHLVTHTKERNFKCTFCAKAFSRKDTLERHLKTHSSLKEKSHKCVECDKSFSFLFTLRKHVRSVHGGEPDGKHCEICGKFIKNRENISRHMMIHADKRPFKCNVCDRAFVQKQHLNDHMAIHSSTLSNICKICGNVFRHRRSLNRHFHKHYSVPSKGVYVCSMCEKQFNSEFKIREHILNSHDRVLFCSLCKMKFSEENDLADHMLREHSLHISTHEKPQLVNKSTETNQTEGECETQVEQFNTDKIEQEAAEELLKFRKNYLLPAGFKGTASMSKGGDNDETSNVQFAVNGTNVANIITSQNNILESECSVNVPDSDIIADVHNDGVVYIVCSDSQVEDGEICPNVISISDFLPQIAGKSNPFVINSVSDNQSDIQAIHIQETINQSGSQIIHIPDTMNQSSGHTDDETGMETVQVERDIGNGLVDNELAGNIDNTLSADPETTCYMNQTHYESDRSVLIQSLIDYAEKIQEEEMLGEDASETKI